MESNLRQVTKLGGANFAPSWHPDGKRLIFASNIHDPKGRNFDAYLINLDGSGLERVTFNETFDGFPDVFAGRQASGVRVQPQRQGRR